MDLTAKCSDSYKQASTERGELMFIFTSQCVCKSINYSILTLNNIASLKPLLIACCPFLAINLGKFSKGILLCIEFMLGTFSYVCLTGDKRGEVCVYVCVCVYVTSIF